MKCTRQTAPEIKVIIIKCTVICKLTEVESAILFYRSYERSITLWITSFVHCDSRQQPLELKEFLHKGCLRCNHMASNSIVLTIAKNGQCLIAWIGKKMIWGTNQYRTWSLVSRLWLDRFILRAWFSIFVIVCCPSSLSVHFVLTAEPFIFASVGQGTGEGWRDCLRKLSKGRKKIKRKDAEVKRKIGFN